MSELSKMRMLLQSIDTAHEAIEELEYQLGAYVKEADGAEKAKREEFRDFADSTECSLREKLREFQRKLADMECAEIKKRKQKTKRKRPAA